MSSENPNDRISRLPEDVVSHILSLMPTKYAVRTSVLSKRWKYSWMFVTTLEFAMVVDYKDRMRSFNSFTKFVDRVLEFCKSPQLQLFRLHTSYWVAESNLPTWIDKAVKLNVREVDLQLSLRHLSSSLWTCKTLTKLRLCHNLITAVWECPCLVSLPCLKTLDIVVFANSQMVNAFKIIGGCPILESLSLEICSSEDYEEGDNFVFDIPTLKRLKLTLKFLSRKNKVFLNVPKLEHLFLGGDVCSLFVMEDVSSLTEATLSFTRFGFIDDHLWVSLFNGLSGVKSLSAQSMNDHGCFPLVLPFPVFPNMIHLELKRFWDPGFIPHILERCPQLTCLYVDHTDCLIAFLEPKLVPACLQTKLTTIKFKFNGRRSDMEFLEYVLRNAKVLKTVTITWHNIHIEREMPLGAQLLKVTRASPDCEITYIRSCSPSNSVVLLNGYV